MNLPIPAPLHDVAPRSQALSSPFHVSAGRPKFLPTHWPLPEIRLRQPASLSGPIESPNRRWPSVVLKVLAVALCYALVRDADAAETLSLRYGEPQVLSALGEPVDIRIPITSPEVGTDARFILGQQDSTLGLPLIRHANIRLERDARGWALRIQSNRRSTDPAMALVVQEVVGGGVVSRTLPVLFDPVAAQPPLQQRAAAEPVEPAPTQLGSHGESWWTAAVANPRPMAPVSAVPQADTLPAAATESIIASASDVQRAQPARPMRGVDRVARDRVRAPVHATELASARIIEANPRARANPMPASLRQPAQANAHWQVNAASSGLRMATALNVSNTSSAGHAVADRERLRWLQRSLLGEDRAAMLALSRKVVQLSAQVEGLELRLAESAQAGRQTVAQPAQANAGTTSTGGATQAPATPNTRASNPQPLKISALMSDPASRKDANPWGLPLLAGLMLGAGYWSGRRSRDEGG